MKRHLILILGLFLVFSLFSKNSSDTIYIQSAKENQIMQQNYILKDIATELKISNSQKSEKSSIPWNLIISILIPILIAGVVAWFALRRMRINEAIKHRLDYINNFKNTSCELITQFDLIINLYKRQKNKEIDCFSEIQEKSSKMDTDLKILIFSLDEEKYKELDKTLFKLGEKFQEIRDKVYEGKDYEAEYKDAKKRFLNLTEEHISQQYREIPKIGSLRSPFRSIFNKIEYR